MVNAGLEGFVRAAALEMQLVFGDRIHSLEPEIRFVALSGAGGMPRQRRTLQDDCRLPQGQWRCHPQSLCSIYRTVPRDGPADASQRRD